MTFTNAGYALGSFAPGRCSKWSPFVNCTAGDSSTEPYIVAHNLLLSHAAAVKAYRDKYQMSQKGQIGITLNSIWFEPLHQTDEDHAAADRALAFMYGWFMEPLSSGSYPADMINYVRERLPKFSTEQSSMIKGSFDFIGINYYTANYVTNVPCSSSNYQSYTTDSCLNILRCWFSLAVCLPRRDAGIDELSTGRISLEDNIRIDYYKSHLSFIQTAINEYGVDLRGYFAWSLLDNFEWADGYTVRFGIYYVDFEDGLKRYPKSSAKWFKMFLQRENQKMVATNPM